MVIDFSRTAAYMCPGCGNMTYGEFSLFELSGGRGISVSCGCGRSHLNIFPRTKTEYCISLKCLVCDEEHEFLVPLNDFLKQSLLDLPCPEILIGLGFIGKKEAVEASVADNEAYIREIVAACGLSHTGKNGITILKALDKIQELSDKGALFCECGSTMIDVDVLEDEIVLECCKCGSDATFHVSEIRNGNFSEITEIVIRQKDDGENEKNS